MGRCMWDSSLGSATYWLCELGQVTDVSVLSFLLSKIRIIGVLTSSEILCGKSGKQQTVLS